MEVSLPILLEDCTPAQRVIVDRICRQYEGASADTLTDFINGPLGNLNGTVQIIEDIAAQITEEDRIVFERAKTVPDRAAAREILPALEALSQKFDRLYHEFSPHRKNLKNIAEEFQLHVLAGIEIERQLAQKKVSEADLYAHKEKLEEFKVFFRRVGQSAAKIPVALDNADRLKTLLLGTGDDVRKILNIIRQACANEGPSTGRPGPAPC